MATPTDDYVSYFTSHPLFEVLNLFLLGLGRIVPIIALAPFLGGKTISDPLKLLFGFAIVTIFLPYMVATATVPLTFDIQFIFLLIKEIFIGTLLGFIIAIPFFYTSGAGALIDHQRGSESLQVMDPSTQTQSSPTGTLYNNMLLVIFFYIGAPLIFFDAIYTSYSLFPADQFLPAAFFTAKNPVWHTFIMMFHDVLKLGLQLAAPAVIAILMSDLFLGIANRMAPQVQISFLLWSMKAFLGILLLWAGWWLILRQMELHATNWLQFFEESVRGMAVH